MPGFFNKILSASILIIIFCLFHPSCVKEKQMPDKAYELKCEYQTDPLGIDSPSPRLSWHVPHVHRGSGQSAFHILVAGSLDQLQNDNGDIWDSGKIESDQSVHVPCKGKKLRSGKKYFWKVKIWDEKGQPLSFSAPACWETGLLDPDDWQAKWVGAKQQPKPEIKKWPWGFWIWHPTEIGINTPVYYQKTFSLDKQVQKAVVKVTADNKFTLFINGQEIGSGKHWAKIYEFDITDKLVSGENKIAIQAANTAGDICGLIFSAQITHNDGTESAVNTDGSWLCSTSSQDWQTRKTNWQSVKVLEPYGGPEWGVLEGHYTPARSTMVRKSTHLDKKITRARVYVTGLGSYILYINGQRIGNDLFTPGWTDYPQKIQYQTYDITSALKKGENAFGALLGNMWWSSGMGGRNAAIYSEGPLRFLMQAEIEFADGTKKTVVTDETWRVTDSPILENTVYHGEVYDARMEQKDWDKGGFDDTSWEAATVYPDNGAKRVCQQTQTIQITNQLKPVSISEPKPGIYIFDMGQNMVGFAELKVKGKAGDQVKLRFAELLKPDGTLYRDNLRNARTTDFYTLKGTGTETWMPHFTYRGFRYVEVTGISEKPNKDMITGMVLHSNAPQSGDFSCSNDLINAIHHNINWGLIGNLHSVPTDCPQRDERLGWMGDAQIFAPTACYNRNMALFFTKWQRDITDCQDEDGAVHNVSPTLAVKGPAKPGWGDAVVTIPWTIYRFYGDKRIIEEQFDGMYNWVKYMQNNSKNYIYDREGYGDWIAVEKSPSKPIGAAYFYYSTKLLAHMADIIDRKQEAQELNALSEKIQKAFQEKYYNKSTGYYEGETQAAQLLPLAFGITPEQETAAVVNSLVDNVKKHDNHLTTGFLGTAYLLPMLSDYGHNALAYKVAGQHTYPSWGYMVEKGATTIWELWNSDTEGPSMNSRNHFALGSVGEWFYGYLAGLKPDADKPGFKNSIIRPYPVKGLDYVNYSLATEYGDVKISWENKDKGFQIFLVIPANTTSDFYMPHIGTENPVIFESGEKIIENGQMADNAEGITLAGQTPEYTHLKLTSGTFEFSVK